MQRVYRGAQVRSIVATELRLRLRRTSTVVLMLVICALAYAAVPDPRSGRTLLQASGHRAVYDSATLALATAVLCSTLLSLIGFYLVSDSLHRDRQSRTSSVIAATCVRSADYLTGKFLANAAFLSTIALVSMANVIGMHVLRGERAVVLSTYVTTYAALTGPTALLVAALALIFECVPRLAGRVGDVIYFALWALLMAVPTVALTTSHAAWPAYFDFGGLGLTVRAVRAGAVAALGPSASVSIGSTPYDVSAIPWTFSGLRWTGTLVASRVAVGAIAVSLVALSAYTFDRFDTTGHQVSVARRRRGPVTLSRAIIAPVARPLFRAVARVPVLARLVLTDVVLTLLRAPVLVVLACCGALVSALLPMQGLVKIGIPVLVAVLALIQADGPVRDYEAGTAATVYSVSVMRELYVPIKLLAGGCIALAIVGIPLSRLARLDLGAGASLLIGVAVIVSATVASGLLTRNTKLFTGAFLLFLYVSVSSPTVAALDFLGVARAATTAVRVGYACVALVCVATSELAHRYTVSTRRV